MTSSLLLDTCAVIWLSAGSPIAKGAQTIMREVVEHGDRVLISPISAWELGMLLAKGRLKSSVSAEVWLNRTLSFAGVGYAELTPDILIDASFIPGEPPYDPGDRVIIATARAFGLAIVTRDRKILDYANQGHVKALPC